MYTTQLSPFFLHESGRPLSYRERHGASAADTTLVRVGLLQALTLTK